MRRLLLAASLLVACGGGGDSPPVSTPDAGVTFSPDQVWGPPGTALPPGAEMVSPEEMAALVGSPDFFVVTRAGLDQRVADGAGRLDAARKTVDDLVALGPELDFLRPRPPVESDIVHRTADGSARVTLAGATVIVHGTDWIARRRRASPVPRRAPTARTTIARSSTSCPTTSGTGCRRPRRSPA